MEHRILNPPQIPILPGWNPSMVYHDPIHHIRHPNATKKLLLSLRQKIRKKSDLPVLTKTPGYPLTGSGFNKFTASANHSSEQFRIFAFNTVVVTFVYAANVVSITSAGIGAMVSSVVVVVEVVVVVAVSRLVRVLGTSEGAGSSWSCMVSGERTWMSMLGDLEGVEL